MQDASDAYCSLDVTVLNQVILKELLNIDDTEMNECVSYTTRSTYGMEQVKSGEYGCLIVVNPVRRPCNVSKKHARWQR